MRSENFSEPTESRFVTRALPWWLGVVALLVYGATLNHRVALSSLKTLASVANWPEAPGAARPLTMLVFLPLRALPETWLPLALNFFTACGAALVLVQLARSVSILRHDVVAADPMRQKIPAASLYGGDWAWLPPVFAVLVLGLQAGFWQQATAASGEIFSVLGFAFAFRCVLEFRLGARDSWLYGGAFVYALGMADNWLMVGYLPVFVAAIIWVKGFSPFLAGRFLGRLVGCGLLGATAYLVGPLVQQFSVATPMDFWSGLKSQLGAQKHSLLLLCGPGLRLMALSGLLPFLLLAVRWRSHSVQLADDTRLGVFITRATGHFIHGLFLLSAIWMAFEPAMTPAWSALHNAMLGYQYAWALVAGYAVAYLLLFQLPRPQRAAVRWPAGVALLLLVTLPGLLLGRNFGAVHLASGSAWQEFAGQLYDDLPAGKSVVLSDEPLFLLLLRAEGSQRGMAKQPLLIDTHALPEPRYRERLARESGVRWQEPAATNRTAPLQLEQLPELVAVLAGPAPLIYLHPSSGLFLERFSAAPHGWGLRLKPRPQDGGQDRPERKPGPELEVWEQRWETTLARRARQIVAHRAHVAQFQQAPWRTLRLTMREDETARVLGEVYGKSLNYWGVQAQQAGAAAVARQWFQRAVQFNPDNLSARVNLEFAGRQQQGDPQRLTPGWLREAWPGLLAKYQTWPEVIARGGPVDEPTFLVLSGRMYLAAGNPRQGLDCFARSAELAPGWLMPVLWQAQALNALQCYAAAEQLSARVLAQQEALRPLGLAQLLQVRATALRGAGQTNAGPLFVADFVTRHEAVNEVVGAAADLFAAAGDLQSELRWRQLLVRREPQRVDWLVKMGLVELRAGRFEAAGQTLTKALTIRPELAQARLFRAVAALQAGRVADARRDYEMLVQSPAHARQALFALGGIAWRQQDTNAMIQYYQAFLSNSAAATPQAAVALQRLKEWQEE